MKVLSILRSFSAGHALLLLAATTAAAQTSSVVAITVTPADKFAQHVRGSYRIHHLGMAGTDRQALWTRGATVESFFQRRQEEHEIPTVPAPGFYPADLSNPAPAGPTVLTVASHPLFVNCPGPTSDVGDCWGDPGTFLNNLGRSEFIHVVDQYVGSSASNRYTLGKSAAVTIPIAAPLGDNDILGLVHAAAARLGSGYTNIIHVFLPKGVDVCFTGTNQCYSPDNPATFAFCAFHASVTFTDAVGHVLYSVEPFQDVPGCAVKSPSPNGSLVDSTASTLSHELIEAITDPDLNAWFNQTSLSLAGSEIGDECVEATPTHTVVSLNEKAYEIQPEYSNRLHACAFVP